MPIVGMVESARKATAPIVGIPLEGEKPFAVRRDLLVNSLKGLKVIDAGIQFHLQTEKPHQLVVYAVGKNVKAVRKFNLLEWNNFRLEALCWAKSQREARRKKASSPKLSVREREVDKQVKRLQREKSKLYLSKEPPRHPLLPPQYPYRVSVDSAASWYAQKPKRKLVAGIAGQVLRGKTTPKYGYELLRSLGIKFKTFSQQPVYRGRKTYEHADCYWKHLHEFVAEMVGKNPCQLDTQRGGKEADKDDFQLHAESRAEYLATKREAQAIDLQIASILEMEVTA